MGLIGSALGAAGSIFGGVKASRAMKRLKRQIKEERKRNQDWYNMKYNESPTQRADAVELLNMTQENIRNRNREAAARAAMMGGTDDAVAAAKEANNRALSQTMAQINAANDARKDAIEQQYQSNDRAYAQQLNELKAGKASAIAGAVSGLSQAAGDVDFGTAKVGKMNIDL